MAKIMLVEDDNNLREIYEARLQAEGYTIVAAKDGEEALVLAKAEMPDLVISDVMMPKISGFEMLDILRNTENLKDVKVIMLTALGQNDDQQRADRLGADRYLVKSQVTLEDIVNVAHQLLEGDGSLPVVSADPGHSPAPVEEPVAVVPVIAEPVAVAPAPDTSAADGADSKLLADAVDTLVASAEEADQAANAPALPPTEVVVPAPAMPVVETPAPAPAPVEEPVAVVPVIAEPVAVAPAPVEEPVVAAPAAAEPVEVAAEPVVALPVPPAAPVAVPEPVVTAADPVAIVLPSEPLDAETTGEETADIEAQIKSFVETVPNETPVAEIIPEATAAPLAEELAVAEPVIPEPVAVPAPEVAPIAAPAPLEAPQIVAAPAAAAPVAPETAGEATNAPVAGKKIISPLSSAEAPKADLNLLLAAEEAKEIMASGGAPATTVIPAPAEDDPSNISL
jgi:CheY-like chemotaxis protein